MTGRAIRVDNLCGSLAIMSRSLRSRIVRIALPLAASRPRAHRLWVWPHPSDEAGMAPADVSAEVTESEMIESEMIESEMVESEAIESTAGAYITLADYEG